MTAAFLPPLKALEQSKRRNRLSLKRLRRFAIQIGPSQIHMVSQSTSVTMYNSTRSFLTNPSSQSRTASTVPTLSAMGRPPGCAWCAGSPWGSPPGPGRRCGVRSQSLSWFSSCVCRGCPRHFLYRSICIIRRICQCIQILPLVFSGNMPARTGPGGQTAAGHHHIFYRSGHICLSRSAGACWRLSRPSSTLPPIIAHFSVLSG